MVGAGRHMRSSRTGCARVGCASSPLHTCRTPWRGGYRASVSAGMVPAARGRRMRWFANGMPPAQGCGACASGVVVPWGRPDACREACRREAATAAVGGGEQPAGGTCPHYTRPETYKGQKVPEVLLSGNHAAIKSWRLKQSLGRTWLRRPDLLAKVDLDEEQEKLLKEFKCEFEQEVKS